METFRSLGAGVWLGCSSFYICWSLSLSRKHQKRQRGSHSHSYKGSHQVFPTSPTVLQPGPANLRTHMHNSTPHQHLSSELPPQSSCLQNGWEWLGITNTTEYSSLRGHCLPLCIDIGEHGQIKTRNPRAIVSS